MSSQSSSFTLHPPNRTALTRKQATELLSTFGGTPWTSVTIGGCAMGDAAMGVAGPLLNDLAAMRCLQHVDFSDCIASLHEDEALRSLSSLATSVGQWKHLLSVNLSDNALGSKGVAACEALMKGQSALQRIYFLNNGLAAESARLLASYFTPGPATALHTIHFHNNCLESRGLIDLAALVENSPLLESLRLSSLRAQPDGTLAVAHALSAATHLRELNLSDNTLDEEGATQLAVVLAAQPNLTKLELADMSMGDDALSTILSTLSDAECPLQHLDISGNDLTSDAATTIAALLSAKSSTLQVLNISDNELEDDGIREISTAISTATPACALTRVSVGTNLAAALPLVELAIHLRTLPSLQSFNVNGNNMSTQTAERFAEAFGPSMGLVDDMEDVDEDEEQSEELNSALTKLVDVAPTAVSAAPAVQPEDTPSDASSQSSRRARTGWFSIFRGNAQPQAAAGDTSVERPEPSESESSKSSESSEPSEGAERAESVSESTAVDVEPSGPSGHTSMEQDNDVTGQPPGKRADVASSSEPTEKSTTIMTTSTNVKTQDPLPVSASPVATANSSSSSYAVLESAKTLKKTIEALGREVSEVKVELELAGTPSARRRLDFGSSRGGDDARRTRDDYLLIGDQITPSGARIIVDALGGLLICFFLVLIVLAVAQSQEESTFSYRPV